MLHRFPKGWRRQGAPEAAAGRRPPWVETVRLHFPRWDRTADELCVTELAQVIWAVQMSTVEFHPWNSRAATPRSPTSGASTSTRPTCDFATVQRVAHVAHEVLDELGAVGFPKTTGGKGMHVYVRIRPSTASRTYAAAALAFAREVERAPRRRDHDLVAQGPRPAQLFVDYNQNARDHTIAAAYSVRGCPTPGLDADPLGRGRRRRPARLHDRTVPARFAELGDLHAASTSTSSTSPAAGVGRARRAAGAETPDEPGPLKPAPGPASVWSSSSRRPAAQAAGVALAGCGSSRQARRAVHG
jgi:DNA primase